MFFFNGLKNTRNLLILSLILILSISIFSISKIYKTKNSIIRFNCFILHEKKTERNKTSQINIRQFAYDLDEFYNVCKSVHKKKN